MIKNGYLMLPISAILKCQKVEDVVVEEGEEWLWKWMYNHSQLYSPKSKITKIISNIKLSRQKSSLFKDIKSLFTPKDTQILTNDPIYLNKC